MMQLEHKPLISSLSGGTAGPDVQGVVFPRDSCWARTNVDVDEEIRATRIDDMEYTYPHGTFYVRQESTTEEIIKIMPPEQSEKGESKVVGESMNVPVGDTHQTDDGHKNCEPSLNFAVTISSLQPSRSHCHHRQSHRNKEKRNVSSQVSYVKWVSQITPITHDKMIGQRLVTILFYPPDCNGLKALLLSMDPKEDNKDKFKFFPNFVLSVRDLEILCLDNNIIRDLPAKIDRLACLKVLDLDKNVIERLPKQLGKLRNLEELYIANNHLQELPEEMKHLAKLRLLNLRNNNLKRFPRVLLQLTKLVALLLDNNGIEEIPGDVDKFKDMKVLLLRGNLLVTLPETLWALTELSCLMLCYNAIEELSDGILNLRNLHTFAINGNKIVRLPEKLSQLKSLKILSFTGNRIEHLPDSFEALELVHLLLEGNPLTAQEQHGGSTGGTSINDQGFCT
ncbi:leucine-rich repeat-containing protein 1-like [Branchiostoma floridae]|uniref:Leucine-rich repeat-containing protein 1-like n=1 Tax=Branchiostoma floridae TaxID=7739 RepID=A0A9J7MMT7_BRAFL|nr:leucine-rich repeat-containing protein 1-like [Branchiostoma floridae]